ncbi:hypothetical protein BIW11_01175 [Tropilaelaps mercedesae]|uniref:Uncharacterized protein n=1 Tax=Tropilaelaps mercedesae TaxID=418985 RepID=A0A1V9XI77_9ACAR|nr:hypothetical protein BIW11_01175 [Tropilaelaps mercedesae]
MGEKCDACGENGVLYNEEQRCEICCFCGVVGEVALVAGSTAALDTDVRTFCNESTVTKFRIGKRGVRQGICTSSNVLGSMGKTGILGREQLLHMLATFEVSAAASDEALALYKDCCRKRFPHREAKALAGGVLMYIMRREKRSLTFREIAEACGSTVKDVGKQFKNVSEKIIQKGGHAPVQPSLGDTIQQSIELYANKFYRSYEAASGQHVRNEYRIPEVITKALDLADWIDRCTMTQRCPAHLFALSVFFLAFKAVNVDRFFKLKLAEFNAAHNFYPMSNLRIPSFYKISPNALIQVICQVVNKKGGCTMLVSSTSFFFLFDIILQLKSFFAFNVTEEMTSVEGDVAFENFKEVKEAQEMLELTLQDNSGEHDDGNLAMVIPDSELSQYILTQKEQFRKQEAILREQLRQHQEMMDAEARVHKLVMQNGEPQAQEQQTQAEDQDEKDEKKQEQAVPKHAKKQQKMKRSRSDSQSAHPKKAKLRQLQQQLTLQNDVDEFEEEERDPQDATTMLALFRGEEINDVNDDEQHLF